MGNACCAKITAVENEMMIHVQKLVRRPKKERLLRSAAAARSEPRLIDFSRADPSKWNFDEISFDGEYSYQRKLVLDKCTGSISEGLAMLRENPALYECMYWQTDMLDWPVADQAYTFVKRTGSGFTATPGAGFFTLVYAKYQVLPQLDAFERDAFTDSFTQGGKRLGEPLCPGRGFGIADVPTLTLMTDTDPSDISQGGVGDCWLLSAISAVAEYDGAIARLFRKTPDFKNMPRDMANKYIVTLWDLPTWSEVDIEIDERLCTRPGTKELLGCAPSVDGELWVCYLEKAVAAHCGGWDSIHGGTCNHAWRILLGCQEQYTFMEDDDGQWKAFSAYNPNEDRWETFENSPHEPFHGLWPSAWPEVGGGGGLGTKVSADDMFLRMCQWEDEEYIMGCATKEGSDTNGTDGIVVRMCQWEDEEYIMGCGTKAGSDTNDTDGIVDGHAYTVLACLNNVADTGFNMIKVRNPWGKGEFQSGKWDGDGPGWKDYPAVKEALNPVQANDGVFWLEQDEFFRYFKTVYLSAMSMRNPPAAGRPGHAVARWCPYRSRIRGEARRVAVKTR